MHKKRGKVCGYNVKTLWKDGGKQKGQSRFLGVSKSENSFISLPFLAFFLRIKHPKLDGARFMTQWKLILLTSSVLGAVVLSSGCAPLVVGGVAAAAGGTAATATDRRSTGAVVNDEVLESRVKYEIKKKLGNLDEHITIVSYNGRVLLVGEVSTEEGKRIAEETARTSLDVASVYNALVVMPSVSIGQRMSDSTLATRVRSAIVTTKGISLNQMKVDVERGIVYLMGILTPEENQNACKVAAQVSGVRKVVTYVETMSAEEIKERMKNLETHNSGTQKPAEIDQGS